MAEQHAQRIDDQDPDPVSGGEDELQMEWAANICDLLAAVAEEAARRIEESPSARADWLTCEFATSIARRAACDRSLADSLRAEPDPPQRLRVASLELVR